MHTIKTIFVVLILSLTLSDCGFHLRGSLDFQLPEGVEPIFIGSSNANNQLHNELQKLLKAYQVRLTENITEANHQLTILEQKTDRRTASIGRGARAAEIQVTNIVSFQLVDKQGNMILGPITLTERRILQNNPNNVASTRSEEALLQREMLTNLASKIARQVSSANYQHIHDASTPLENTHTQADNN